MQPPHHHHHRHHHHRLNCLEQRCSRKQAKRYAHWLHTQRSPQELSDTWWAREEARWATEAAARSATAATTQAPQVSEAEPQGRSAAPEGGGTSLPACTWQPESGGNPHALNESSGAGGYYQITPETWAANGGQGAPQNAPMGEQTRVAESVMRTQGAHAWVNC